MKYINAKGEFVKEGADDSAYQVEPDSADGKRLIASLRGEETGESPVTTAVSKPVKVPKEVEDEKPKVKHKK